MCKGLEAVKSLEDLDTDRRATCRQEEEEEAAENGMR